MNIRMIALAGALVLTSTSAFAQSAMEENMMAMNKMMSDTNGMETSGNADMDFTMMMIPHHQAAIDMAEVQLKYGKDPQLRKMAQMIIDAQKKEIAEMKDWQKKHGH